MKAKKRMLAFVLALSLTVTSFAGWTSQSDNTAAVKASASVSDVSSVSSVSPSAPLTLSTDLEYVGSTSALNTIRLRLDGSTFKEGISKSDIRLDNAFKEMSVKGVSSDGDTVTLTLKGTPVKNEQVNIYEPGKVVVLASGINGAKDYVQVDIPVMSPYLGFDPESIKAEGEKITADIIAYDIGDINAITKDNVTVEGVKVIAAEKKDYKTIAVTFEADGVKTVNDFAALVNGKKMTAGAEETDIYLPEASINSYLDYCEQNGDDLDITLDIYANNGSFADKLTTDMVSFGEQFKGAKAKSVAVEDGIAKLQLSVAANGMTPEDFNLYGEVALSPDALVNVWGDKPSEAVSDSYIFTGSAVERKYEIQGDMFSKEDLLDIQGFVRGRDTDFGNLVYWGSAIGSGIGALVSLYSGVVKVLQICGYLQSEHDQTMQTLKEILQKIDKMQYTLDEQTKMLLQIQADVQQQKLEKYCTYLRQLKSANKALAARFNQAKKDLSLTTWLKGEPLPTGYTLTDANRNELAADAKIPDDYKILDPNGREVKPTKVIDPQTASQDEIVAYNEELIAYIYAQMDAKNPNYIDFTTQYSNLTNNITNLCDLINDSGVGVGKNPFDEFDKYCSLYYNFDSQSYLPRVAFRESAFTTLTQSMGMLATCLNLYKNEDNAIYIDYNIKYQAALKKIDQSVPTGNAPESIKAYPHDSEKVTVSDGNYISDIKLSGMKTKDAAVDLLKSEGYTVIDKDLNDNAGGYYIYLGYKTTDNYDDAIKDLVICNRSELNQLITTLSLNDAVYSLAPYVGTEKFVNEKGALNCDAGGKWLWLFYTKEEIPDKKAVEKIFFDKKKNIVSTNNVSKVLGNDGTTFWDLNDGAGGGSDSDLYMYSIRGIRESETFYLFDLMTAAASSEAAAKKQLTDAGFIVIDQDTNKNGGGDYVYVGYKTTDNPKYAIKGLCIRRESSAISSSIASITRDGKLWYMPAKNNTNLNSNSGGKYLYLYFTREAAAGDPIQAIWFNSKKDGSVDKQDLNESAGGDDIYLHFVKHLTNQTQEMPFESDPNYYPYCYTLGTKVCLMCSKDYEFYYDDKRNLHHAFTDAERIKFVEKMTTTTIRDELYSAGLLRDEELFKDMKNMNLATDFTSKLCNSEKYGVIDDDRIGFGSGGDYPAGYYNYYETKANMLDANGKTYYKNIYVAEDYYLLEESTRPDKFNLSPLEKKNYHIMDFLLLKPVATDYSATKPVQQDYADCIGVDYQSGKLNYYMDLGSDVKNGTTAKVVLTDNTGDKTTVTISQATDYTNPKNGLTYKMFSIQCTSETAAEASTAKFYFDDNSSFDLPKYSSHTYTVTWVNYDGTVLEIDKDVLKGTMPDYNGSTPTRPTDEGERGFAYSFAGWVTGDATDPVDFVPVTSDVVYTASYNSESKSRIVTIKAEDVNGNDVQVDIGAQAGTGYYTLGQKLTFTAPDAENYNFVGWYDKNARKYVWTSKTYSFTVTKSLDLAAVYKAIGNAQITIVGGNSYTLNGKAKSTSVTDDYKLGTSITLVANDANFAYWKNDYGMILSRSREYTFTVTGKDNITAIFDNEMEEQATIVFKSAYDQAMKRVQFTADEEIVVPDIPTYNGYVGLGWDMDGDGRYDAEKDTIEAAKARAFAADNKTIVISPVYQKLTYKYEIVVYNGTITQGTADADGKFEQNMRLVVQADAPETGKKFSHWRDGAYNVLGYNPTYTFNVDRNLSLYAVYVDQNETVDAKGITAITSMTKDPINHKMIFVSFSTVPEGCKIEKAGIIATNIAGIGTSETDFVAENAAFVRAGTSSTCQSRYTWTKSNVNNGDTWYVRAYLVYRDADNVMHTVYGDIVSQTMGIDDSEEGE